MNDSLFKHHRPRHQMLNKYLTLVPIKHKLEPVTNEKQRHNASDSSLTDSALDDLEVELSKVEATMQAIADGAEIESATSWLNRL
jgi:hypothetical protein